MISENVGTDRCVSLTAMFILHGVNTHFYFMCEYLSVCTQCLQRPKGEGMDTLELELLGGCELPCRVQEYNL